MLRQVWLACTATGMILPLTAVAHAKLLSTSPAAGEQVDAAPKALTLKFNEAVQLAVLKLSADGKDIPVAVDRGAAAAAEVTVALPALAAGTYQVQWSAHNGRRWSRREGHLFICDREPHLGRPPKVAAIVSIGVWDWLAVLVKAVLYAATLGAAGGVFFLSYAGSLLEPGRWAGDRADSCRFSSPRR